MRGVSGSVCDVGDNAFASPPTLTHYATYATTPNYYTFPLLYYNTVYVMY